MSRRKKLELWVDFYNEVLALLDTGNIDEVRERLQEKRAFAQERIAGIQARKLERREEAISLTAK